MSKYLVPKDTELWLIYQDGNWANPEDWEKTTIMNDHEFLEMDVVFNPMTITWTKLNFDHRNTVAEFLYNKGMFIFKSGFRSHLMINKHNLKIT